MRRSTLAYSTMCLAINALTLKGTNNLPPGVLAQHDHSNYTCAEKLAILSSAAQGERNPDKLAALAAKEAEVRAQCEGLELAETESGMEPTELAQWLSGFVFSLWHLGEKWTCPKEEETWLGYYCYFTEWGHPDDY